MTERSREPSIAPRHVLVLGSTGSIGTQTLDVIARLPDRLRVWGLVAHSNGELLMEQARATDCRHLALVNESSAQQFEVQSGIEAACEFAEHPEVDIVVVAVAGMIGLKPTLAALRAGKHVALASKEVLVAAGEVATSTALAHGAPLLPIDSEHSAILQCLGTPKRRDVRDIVLTASGGPFRGWKRSDLATVTAEQALNHPTWRMGGKITVDSATLMNKGLEMIEARWLFDLEPSQIDAVIHPQSIIHSFVRFDDGSVLGQFGVPDMRMPIQYALLYPDRVDSGLATWNPLDTPNLTFGRIDDEAFPGPRLCRQAMETAGTAPCILNAVNEEAANAFLRGQIGFLEITEAVEAVLGRAVIESATLDHVLAADKWARETFRERYRLK
ncbi:MAG: 1-deoxy-D-xylulose-5-phosphate reductoisomerase [Fimbriimonadaceae bacterium]